MEVAYRSAQSLHPCGFVSVSAFRNVLDEIQMKQIRSGTHPMTLGEAA